LSHLSNERPEAGTVRLVGAETARIVRHSSGILSDETAYATMAKAHNRYGEAMAAERIATVLEALNPNVS
jgi:UDP-N-acetylglucosamine 2-epimerase (non-hydrolysing)